MKFDREVQIDHPNGTLQVVVRRSTARRRTAALRREGDHYVVMIPNRLSLSAEKSLVIQLVNRAEKKRAELRPPADDEELNLRAVALAVGYLDEIAGRKVRPNSIRWVKNQQKRWGSNSLTTGDIRLSDRLRTMPDWVVDYVILHELAHFVETNHTKRFHSLVNQYARATEAEAFLAGWIARDRQLLDESF